MLWYAATAASQVTQVWMYAHTSTSFQEHLLNYARIASPNPAASP